MNSSLLKSIVLTAALHGGNGGGGGGGPSVGLQRSGGSVAYSGNTYTIGTRGAGGTRGSNLLGQGVLGSAGVTASVR